MFSEDDINFISKQREKYMEGSYNKVQYSEFTPDRVGQWVLRGDTIEEVLELKEKLFGMAKPAVVAPIVTPATPPPTQATTPRKELTPDEIITKYGLTDMLALQVKTPCKRCGAQQVYNPKTGKVFCSARCWAK